MSDLSVPAGWATASLEEIASVIRGVAFAKETRKSDPQPGFIACLRTTNVQTTVEWDDVWFIPAGVIRREEQMLHAGDVLMSTANSYELVGKVAQVTSLAYPSTLGAFITAIRASAAIEPRFLYYQLAWSDTQSRVRELASTTTNISNVSSTKLANLTVRIAPFAEQRRIVSVLEEHLSDLDAAVAGLQRAKANIVRFRTATISAEVVGVLDSRTSTRSTADDWDLPEGWAWVRLRDVAAIKGGITKGQKRRAGELIREVPYLRVANVQRGYLDLREVKCIEATEKEIDDLRLIPGDVLFNEGGDRDKLGRGWVWSGEIEECIHQNHVFRARLDTARFNPKFVSYFANTWGQRYFLEQGKQTTNLASINLTKLGGLQIPGPPRQVQDEIVERLEQRLAVAGRTAAEIDVQLARAARLRQSILSQAFEGKLVTQDPSDEPASALVARCREVSQASTAAERPARSHRTRSAVRRERN